MRTPTVPATTRLAVRAAGAASRLLHRGAGVAVSGRVLTALTPDALERLSVDRRVVMVSGTNGKSTTTRFIAEAWRRTGPVATNADGANLASGLAHALYASDHPQVVLEVDEQVLPAALVSCRPQLVVLLNLSRDQLDRVGETRKTAQAWNAALTRTGDHPPQVLVNADDPQLVVAARGVPHVTWIGAGVPWDDDARVCPECGSSLVVTDGWRCPGCGLARPEVWLERRGDSLEWQDRRAQLDLRLPDEGSRVNATMAVAASTLLGVDLDDTLKALSEVKEVNGRYAMGSLDGHDLRLLLMKNPASARNALTVLSQSDRPVVISFNAEAADGRDPSWLYDVSFDGLRGRQVVVTGRRALDLSVRLTYAGVAHRVAADVPSAVALLDAGPVDVLANYTAFAAARRWVTPSAAC